MVSRSTKRTHQSRHVSVVSKTHYGSSYNARRGITPAVRSGFVLGVSAVLISFGAILTPVHADNASPDSDDDNNASDTIFVQSSSSAPLESSPGVTEVISVTDDLYIVEYADSVAATAALDYLATDPAVTKTLPDVKVHAADLPSAASTASSTATSLSPASFATLTSTSAAGAPSVSSSAATRYAWGTMYSGMYNYTQYINDDMSDTITIAVLDSGIYKNHEAFTASTTADRIDYTYAYDYANRDTSPADDNGHGTAVSGVIAQSTPADVKILPLKVLDRRGEGYLSDIAEAIEDVTSDRSADIINMSLGVEPDDLDPEDVTILDAIFQSAADVGIILVAAAGNESGPVDYPATSPSVWTASSVDQYNNFSDDFSNSGPEVDFALPGEGLSLPCRSNTACYSSIDGTSFSSPYLASAIALILADHPLYSATEVYDELKRNAVLEEYGSDGEPILQCHRDASGHDPCYGWGRVDFRTYKFNSPVTISNHSATIRYLVAVDAIKITSDWPVRIYTNTAGTGTYRHLTPTHSHNTTYTFPIDNDSSLTLHLGLVGDVNMNGSVTMQDATFLARTLLDPSDVNYTSPTVLQFLYSDVNNNGSTTMQDATIVARSLLDPFDINYRAPSW